MHPPDYWPVFVHTRFPQYAWAVEELPRALELDDLCVELDVITGVPAVYLRSEILALRLGSTGDAGADFLNIHAQWIGLADARLACWMSCAAIRSVLSQTRKFVRQCTPTVEKLESWCTYFDPYVSFDDDADMYSSRVGRSLANSIIETTQFTIPQRPSDSDGISANRALSYLIQISEIDIEEVARAYKDAMMTYPVRMRR